MRTAAVAARYTSCMSSMLRLEAQMSTSRPFCELNGRLLSTAAASASLTSGVSSSPALACARAHMSVRSVCRAHTRQAWTAVPHAVCWGKQLKTLTS